MDVNIEVSLVPLIANPMRNEVESEELQVKKYLTYEERYYKRQYLKGVCVMRIKVKPT